MSYDVWLEIDTGGPESVEVGPNWNYTSNCSPMWRKAGADIAEFANKTAGECLPVLLRALTVMKSDPATYRAMDPPNGWGSYDTLIPALEALAANFARHPKANVRVSR